jgi:rhomboid protease GluP
MLNEPSKDKKPRRPHPLEAPPPKPDPEKYRGQQVTLHMPVSKPYAVWVLIGINALVYIIAQYVMTPVQQFDFYNGAWNNQQAVLEFGEYHRLTTAMFLHSLNIPFHIVFNMFALYAIGVTVERFFGTVRFLLVYFLGGITGSILSVLLNGPSVNSVGASGAVFAIIAAEIVFLFNHRKLFGEMAQNQLRQLVIITLLNLAVGVFGAVSSSSGGQIDNWGHIGGFLGGFIIAYFIVPVFIPRKHPTQPNALTIEDINPLNKHYQTLLLFVSGLLFLLVAGTFLIG